MEKHPGQKRKGKKKKKIIFTNVVFYLFISELTNLNMPREDEELNVRCNSLNRKHGRGGRGGYKDIDRQTTSFGDRTLAMFR